MNSRVKTQVIEKILLHMYLWKFVLGY